MVTYLYYFLFYKMIFWIRSYVTKVINKATHSWITVSMFFYIRQKSDECFYSLSFYKGNLCSIIEQSTPVTIRQADKYNVMDIAARNVYLCQTSQKGQPRWLGTKYKLPHFLINHFTISEYILYNEGTYTTYIHRLCGCALWHFIRRSCIRFPLDANKYK